LSTELETGSSQSQKEKYILSQGCAEVVHIVNQGVGGGELNMDGQEPCLKSYGIYFCKEG